MTDTQRPRGPYRRGVERRREIVSVATEVFGQHGFKGGTLQQVADRVGVTPGAIMKLFGNKEGLLIAVLQNWDVVTGAVVGPGSRGVRRLKGYLDLMEYHIEHKGLLELYATMAVEAASLNHPAHGLMNDRYRRSLANNRNLFRDAIAKGDFRPMTESEIASEAEWLLATMDGLEIQYLHDPDFDLRRSFSNYVGLLVHRLSAIEALPSITARFNAAPLDGRASLTPLQVP